MRGFGRWRRVWGEIVGGAGDKSYIWILCKSNGL